MVLLPVPFAAKIFLYVPALNTPLIALISPLSSLTLPVIFGYPNIYGLIHIGDGPEGGAYWNGGSFYKHTETCSMHDGAGSNNSFAVGFMASRSNSLYKDNVSSVQPDSAQTLMIIKI